MPSVRELVIEAALAALNTNTPSGVPQTSRARQEPYTPQELPALTVKPIREEIEYEQIGKAMVFRRRVLTLRLTASVTGDDSAADPLLTWATSVLDGPGFATPKLIEDCIEALYEWEYAAEDQPYLSVHQDFRVHYHTIVGDQTRAQ